MRAMKSLLSLCFLLSVAVLGACGGKSSSAAEPRQTEPLAPGAWEAMSDKDRASFMKHTVMPVMAAKFKEWDDQQKLAGGEEEFGEVTCKTCHGPGAAEGKFEMPSGALPELDFANPDPDDEQMNKFMGEVVKPTMANLLGMPEYTPENPTGFGCLACHTMAKGE